MHANKKLSTGTFERQGLGFKIQGFRVTPYNLGPELLNFSFTKVPLRIGLATRAVRRSASNLCLFRSQAWVGGLEGSKWT